MKQQWWAYVIVAVLAIGAGVAIAGLPNSVPVDATIIAPSTTEAPAPTLPERTPLAPSSTTSTTAPPATDTTQPASPDTTEPPVTGLPERGQLAAVSANGANVNGAATRFADLLESAGYVDVAPLNGTTIAETTVVYYADGLEASASRMAVDLGVAPEAIAPLADMPSVLELGDDAQLVAYVGRDIALPV